MELEGDYFLQASPEAVWTALHDVDLLTRCVPGCEFICWQTENTLEAGIELRLGNLQRSYRGEVRITDQSPYAHYRLLFGKPGTPSRVAADIDLNAETGGTRLTYRVEAALDGYLERLGASMVGLVARRIANRFFKILNAEITTREA